MSTSTAAKSVAGPPQLGPQAARSLRVVGCSEPVTAPPPSRAARREPGEAHRAPMARPLANGTGNGSCVRRHRPTVAPSRASRATPRDPDPVRLRCGSCRASILKPPQGLFGTRPNLSDALGGSPTPPPAPVRIVQPDMRFSPNWRYQSAAGHCDRDGLERRQASLPSRPALGADSANALKRSCRTSARSLPPAVQDAADIARTWSVATRAPRSATITAIELLLPACCSHLVSLSLSRRSSARPRRRANSVNSRRSSRSPPRLCRVGRAPIRDADVRRRRRQLATKDQVTAQSHPHARRPKGATFVRRFLEGLYPIAGRRRPRQRHYALPR